MKNYYYKYLKYKNKYLRLKQTGGSGVEIITAAVYGAAIISIPFRRLYLCPTKEIDKEKRLVELKSNLYKIIYKSNNNTINIINDDNLSNYIINNSFYYTILIKYINYKKNEIKKLYNNINNSDKNYESFIINKHTFIDKTTFTNYLKNLLDNSNNNENNIKCNKILESHLDMLDSDISMEEFKYILVDIANSENIFISTLRSMSTATGVADFRKEGQQIIDNFKREIDCLCIRSSTENYNTNSSIDIIQKKISQSMELSYNIAAQGITSINNTNTRLNYYRDINIYDFNDILKYLLQLLSYINKIVNKNYNSVLFIEYGIKSNKIYTIIIPSQTDCIEEEKKKSIWPFSGGSSSKIKNTNTGARYIYFFDYNSICHDNNNYIDNQILNNKQNTEDYKNINYEGINLNYMFNISNKINVNYSKINSLLRNKSHYLHLSIMSQISLYYNTGISFNNKLQIIQLSTDEIFIFHAIQGMLLNATNPILNGKKVSMKSLRILFDKVVEVEYSNIQQKLDMLPNISKN